ncbi:MAG TPA: hypothetical protein VFC85_01285 [Verrucomicrobiae bacterium]|nr:hypothetical protein [Verrucomicrobiae bacterium]
MNNKSQAIQVRKKFHVHSDEVFLKKTSTGFTIVERNSWKIFEEGCRELSDCFMAKRIQPPHENRH